MNLGFQFRTSLKYFYVSTNTMKSVKNGNYFNRKFSKKIDINYLNDRVNLFPNKILFLNFNVYF